MSTRDAQPPASTRPPARVAVLIPCLDEEQTVALVVGDFRRALPNAAIYVFDNNSTDHTAARAAEAGAIVVASARRGKGAVVRHMFKHVDADIYVMVDGDATYPAEEAPRLLAEFNRTRADMLVGTRMQTTTDGAFRLFHRFGNWLFASLINRLFRVHLTDVLSGYRVFTREFVRFLPLSSEGFEIETELTLQAIGNGFDVQELPVPYGKRPPGSESKLSTVRDGVIILQAIVNLFRRYKPLVFFTFSSVLMAVAALAAGTLPILDYLYYKYVHHLPLAVLAAGLGVLSALLFCVGLILDNLAQYHRSQVIALRALLAERNDDGRA
jgi:glycosyltransferase involved in cell wall biosynthesis